MFLCGRIRLPKQCKFDIKVFISFIRKLNLLLFERLWGPRAIHHHPPIITLHWGGYGLRGSICLLKGRCYRTNCPLSDKKSCSVNTEVKKKKKKIIKAHKADGTSSPSPDMSEICRLETKHLWCSSFCIMFWSPCAIPLNVIFSALMEFAGIKRKGDFFFSPAASLGGVLHTIIRFTEHRKPLSGP